MPKFVYDREVQDQIGRYILKLVIPMLFIGVVLCTVTFIFNQSLEWKRIVVGVVLIGYTVVVFGIALRGRVKLALSLYMVFNVVALIFAMYFNGGVSAPLYVGNVIMVALAAWYFTLRFTFLLTCMYAALGAVFVGLEYFRVLPESVPLNPVGQCLLYGTVYFTLMVLCSFPSRMLHRELARSKERERESANMLKELRRTSLELTRYEAESREAQRMAKLGYWSREPDSNAIEVSSEIFAMAGVEPHPMTIEELIQHVYPADRRAIYEAQLHADGHEQDVEFRIVRPDGEIRWIAEKRWSEFDEDGREVRRRGISQDITAQKRIEQLLEMEMSLSRALLDAPSSDVALRRCLETAISASGMDCGGIYIETDDGGLRMVFDHGCLPAFIASKDNLPPGHPTVQLVRRGQPIFAEFNEIAGTLNAIEREEGLLGIAVLPIVYEQKVIGCLCVASHANAAIPEHARRVLEIIANQAGGAIMRAKDRQALSESEARFRRLVETSGDIIWEADAAGHITYVSPHVSEVLGYRPEELMGKHCTSFLTEDSARNVKEAIRAAYLNRTGWRNVSEQFRTKDGGLRWIENNAVILLDASGKVLGFQGSDRDVTDRVRMEQEKASLEKQYIQAQKMEAVGQLAGGVAHDFNNLLQVITGAGSLTLDELPPDHGARESLEMMLEASRKAALLVDQMLAFSRRQIMQPQVLYLNDTIAELLNMVRRVIGADIQLSWTPSPEASSVFADRSMMEQLVMNLCVNARDAMPKGGELYLSTRVERLDAAFCREHSWARPGSFVVLRVRDTGCGIPPEIMERMFEPFFTTKEVDKGTGLGLATVYAIVQRHEGLIAPRSELGRGATFDIYLPLAESSAPPVAPPAAPVKKAAGGTETILLAEDNDIVRSVARNILRKAGYTVIEAVNGEEAIERIREQGEGIHLALLDVLMPRLGGREVYDFMQKHGVRIPVLFASGYSEGGIHTDFVLEKGLTLLGKPFERAELLETVRRLLDGNEEF